MMQLFFLSTANMLVLVVQLPARRSPFHYNNRFILATACYQHVPADRITDRIVTVVLQKK